MNNIPRNIELFDQVVALTLVKLYESFPNPLDLDATSIGADAAESANSDIVESFQLMMETAENSINFLVQEGFVRYSASARTLNGCAFPGASLTLRGFALLGTAPEAVNESIDRRPFIDQLRGAVQEGAESSVAEIVKSLFIGAIKLGASALGAS